MAEQEPEEVQGHFRNPDRGGCGLGKCAGEEVVKSRDPGSVSKVPTAGCAMMDGRGAGDDGGAAGLAAARLLRRVTRQVLGGSGESQCVIGIKVPVKHWAGEK